MIRINVFKRVTGSRIVFMVALLASSGELLYGMENKTGLKIPAGFLKNIPLKKIANVCTFPVRLVHGYAKQHPKVMMGAFFIAGTFFGVHKWLRNMRAPADFGQEQHDQQLQQDINNFDQIGVRTGGVLSAYSDFQKKVHSKFDNLKERVARFSENQTVTNGTVDKKLDSLCSSAREIIPQKEVRSLGQEIRDFKAEIEEFIKSKSDK